MAVRHRLRAVEGLGQERRRRPAAAVGTATRQAGWALLMPVIILGGIYGGIFTPTEASAVAVFYALVVGMFIYREIERARPATRSCRSR